MYLIITLRVIPENLFSLSALTGYGSVQQDEDVGLKVKEKQVGK